MHIQLALLYHAFLIISSCKQFETKLPYGVWSQQYFKSSSNLKITSCLKFVLTVDYVMPSVLNNKYNL